MLKCIISGKRVFYKSGSLLSFDVFRRCAISSGRVGIILILSKDNGTIQGSELNSLLSNWNGLD